MDFSMCPRAKRIVSGAGTFGFKTLKIFSVGGGERFVRFLRAAMPELKVESVAREDANLILSVATIYSSKNEYCYLRILGSHMEINCRDEAGARNAAAIFAQIIRRDGDTFILPCGCVEDYPDAQYRGFMLETSGRAYMPMNEILEYIRLMAMTRMNELQFHFMEGAGTTIALDSFPSLNGGKNGGGKFTKNEIQGMIAYADDLGITVTPFVEVLSHSVDFTLKAGIGCPGDTLKNMYAVCVGQEKTYEAIEKLLAEVAELFPSPVLHIGGDEYDMCRVSPRTAYWAHCPHCQKVAKMHGFTTMRELFHYAVERVNQIVNKLGKVAMVWNADMKPGCLPEWLERNMVVHFFRTDHPFAKELLTDMYPNGYAEEGYSVLNSFYPNTYLNDNGSWYANDERINDWSYHRTPAVSHENLPKIVGGCFCAWVGESLVRSIPPCIILAADRLWNADDSGVPYNDAYGCVMTRVMFGGRLPENMNVFRMVGRILPPQSAEEKVHKAILRATLDEVLEIKNALLPLASAGHRLAAIYADMATAAEEYIRSLPDELKPLNNTIHFVG